MKIRNFYLLLLAVLFVYGCTSSSEEELIGNWKTIGDFDGSTRSDATSFVIGDTAYICLGYNAKDKALKDLYKYDLTTKSWETRAEFPGKPRYAATSFTAAGKAYVGLGYNNPASGVEIYKDFWEYDPKTNQWTEVSDEFPGSARYYAVGASVNGIGLVGTGTNDASDLKDFFSFTPGTTPGSGKWSKMKDYEGTKRRGASCFVINNDFYLLGGITNSSYPIDMQKYDAGKDRWERVLDLRNTDQTTDDDKYDRIPRAFANAFVINGKAYLTLGEKGSFVPSTFEYDPTTNKWTEKTGFSRTTRSGAVSFTLSETSKSRGFVLTGRSGSTRFDDFFEFFPNDTNNTYDD